MAKSSKRSKPKSRNGAPRQECVATRSEKGAGTASDVQSGDIPDLDRVDGLDADVVLEAAARACLERR